MDLVSRTSFDGQGTCLYEMRLAIVLVERDRDDELGVPRLVLDACLMACLQKRKRTMICPVRGYGRSTSLRSWPALTEARSTRPNPLSTTPWLLKLPRRGSKNFDSIPVENSRLTIIRSLD